MHVHDLARACEGAVSGLARCGTWLSAHVSPQRGASARAKAPWRQVPELSERLRRLTPAGRGDVWLGSWLPTSSAPGIKVPGPGGGWGCGRPRASTPQLGGRDEALPQEAPEGSSTSCSLPRESTCRRLRYRTKNVDGAPNPHAFARAIGRPALAEIGEDIMRWTQGHEGGLMVGKKLYV